MSKHALLMAAGVLTLAGCAAPAPPDYAAQYQPAADAYIAGWNGDLAGLDAAIAEGLKRHASGGLNADSLDSLKNQMTEFRTAYPDMKVVLDESYYLDGQSFHFWTFTGTNTGPGAAPPTGKSVKVTGSTRLRYKDGKIAEEIVYFDALDMQTQLGYMLTSPASAEATAAQ
jgi:hypothetical protein